MRILAPNLLENLCHMLSGQVWRYFTSYLSHSSRVSVSVAKFFSLVIQLGRCVPLGSILATSVPSCSTKPITNIICNSPFC